MTPHRTLTLAAFLLAAAPVVASAARVPATVGPVRIDAGQTPGQYGLEFRDHGAPELTRAPLLAGWTADGDLRTSRTGGVVLLGRYGWVFGGPAPLRMRALGWGVAPDSRFVSEVLSTGDGGFVTVGDLGRGNLDGFGPDTARRWSIPVPVVTDQAVPQPPVALAATDVMYAAGGQASVIDARTGQVTARLDPQPGQPVARPAVAPDGSARLVTDPGAVAVSAYRPDGTRRWVLSLGDANATAPSVGPDGTTYLGTWGSGQTRRGRIVAVSPDGVVLWSARTGLRPARPAIDATGVVWTVTSDGTALGINRTGTIVWRRTVGRSGGVTAPWAVAADAGGVRIWMPPNLVALAPRAQGASRVDVALRMQRQTIRLIAPPTRCFAPTGGRPKSCVTRTVAGGTAVVTTPVDGTARLEIRTASGTLITGLGPYRVLAGTNRIHFTGSDGRICDVYSPCRLPRGQYTLRARVPVSGGRAVWRSTSFTVTSYKGTPVD